MSTEQLEALVVELRGLIAELREQSALQAARIAELEALLDESRRSGKRQAAPFSKGAPKPEPKTPGRKRGSAYGRHATRPVPERVDRELDAGLPARCACGGEIGLVETVAQFQIDLPDPTPIVTKFNVDVGRCRCCRRRVQGRHSDQTSDAVGVGGVQIGPNAIATGLILHYFHGLSFARSTEVLGALGVHLAPSTLVRAAARTADDLETTCQALLNELNAARAVTMDETGWRIGGMPAWLWTATTATTTAYVVCEGRSFDDATALIDATFSGVLIRDGWAPYRKYSAATHQTCVAHLLRRCAEMISDLPAAERHLARMVKDILLELGGVGTAAVAVDLFAADGVGRRFRIGGYGQRSTIRVRLLHSMCRRSGRVRIGRESGGARSGT